MTDASIDAQTALRDRLRAVSVALGLTPPDAADPAEASSLSLLALAEALRGDPSDRIAWLILIAVGGRYPMDEDVVELRRRALVDPPEDLADCALMAVFAGGSRARLNIAAGATVLDVHVSASTPHASGIQRVARRLARLLESKGDVRLSVWTGDEGLRELDHVERARMESADREVESGILVPLDGRVLLTEVPTAERSRRLSALAARSGISVSLIGYDAIPITSRSMVNRREAVKFGSYLSVVKWAGSVAAISAAAAAEFRGFGRMLGAQGLSGPVVVECSLPADPARVVPSVVRSRPLVAVVGSKEPRKNHVAVMYAAERLWREGLDFELLFLGSYGWDTRVFRSWLRRLQRAGRPVQAPAKASDEDLWSAYAGARFTVFPSLHEGYGLPVAESLAYGTPVITTAYGSTGEIAEAGGCVTVDPRDDEQLVAAMRRLLTDDAEVERLRGEARARPSKTWEEYADEVWSVLEVGE